MIDEGKSLHHLELVKLLFRLTLRFIKVYLTPVSIFIGSVETISNNKLT